MKAQYHYLLNEPDKNYFENSVPLHVNGAGVYYELTKKFSPRMRLDKFWRLQLMEYKPDSCKDPDVLDPRQFVIHEADKPYLFALGEKVVTGYYWIHFSGNYVNQLIEKSGLIPEKIYTLQESQMEVMRRDFDLMFTEFILRLPDHEDMLASLLARMIVRLGRFVQEDYPEDIKNRFRKQLEKTVIYIHNHYTEDLSVTELADLTQLSERRFRQIFREAFDMAPSEYIIKLRINYACELLRGTTLPVSHIAESCGYDDTLYFSRLFRKKTGSSPLVYRKNNTVK